jgi:hypothetical protein
LSSDLFLLQRFGEHLDFVAEWPGRATLQPQLREPTLRDCLVGEFLNIRAKNNQLLPMVLNRAQAEYSRTCTRRNIVLKARQLGITTYVAARYFIQTITRPGTLTVQVAHDQESAEEIFRIVHRFWANLPETFRRGALVTSRANVRQIVFPRLDSQYRVATAADENAGRGLTIHNLHCSEVARWPRGGIEALASVRAAVPPAGEIVLESTPNGAAGVFYEEWQRADETGYKRHFFPWWLDPAYTLAVDPDKFEPLNADEQKLVADYSLSREQIAFRRMIHSSLRALAIQEYAEDANSCFRASGECVFDLDRVRQQLESFRDPIEVADNGRLQVWFPGEQGHEYIIAADPAGGGAAGDYACAQVIDRAMGVQCAEWHGHFAPREFANNIIALTRRYPRALVVVERNNHGHAVLTNLRHQNCANIYKDARQNDGWLTSAVTRPHMIENVAAIAYETPQLFHSTRLLNEFRTFVRHADGSTGAVAGAHDDCVMAIAIAFAVREADAGRRAAVEPQFISIET